MQYILHITLRKCDPILPKNNIPCFTKCLSLTKFCQSYSRCCQVQERWEIWHVSFQGSFYHSVLQEFTFSLTCHTNTADGIKTSISCSVLWTLLSKTEVHLYILRALGLVRGSQLIWFMTFKYADCHFPCRLFRGGGRQGQGAVGCIFFSQMKHRHSLFLWELSLSALASIWMRIQLEITRMMWYKYPCPPGNETHHKWNPCLRQRATMELKLFK